MGLGCEGGHGGPLLCTSLTVMSAGVDMDLMSSMKDIHWYTRRSR
jgi:hypothetical protein